MLVINFKTYTDGDWGIDSEFLKNHTSRYFEQDLYEYTILDDYVYKFRRVFNNDELNEALDFMHKLKDGLHGQEYYVDKITEYISTVIEGIELAITYRNKGSENTDIFNTEDWLTGKPMQASYFSFDMDGNTELTFSGYFDKDRINKIKHIEYEK